MWPHARPHHARVAGRVGLLGHPRFLPILSPHRSERSAERPAKKTSNFAAAIACLCLSLPRSRGEAKTLGHKLLKSSTSIAARARAASHSESDADFCSKLEGAIQEADESMLCLEMLRDDCAINEHSLTYLHQEAKEIGTILVSVIGRIRDAHSRRLPLFSFSFRYLDAW